MRWVWKILIGILVFVMIVIAYRVLGVYEFRAGECSARTPQAFAVTYPSRVVVMSFNIEGHATLLDGDHIEEIADTIRRYQPDIVGLNEIHRNTWQSRFSDHTEALARRTGMKILFGRSYRFAGGDFGNAVLTRGEILSSEVHNLPGTGEPRTLLECLIRINGGTVSFYVTHTTAWASLNRKTRRVQLSCINEHVRASTHPYIVTGDLNAPPSAPEISGFLARNLLRLAGDPSEGTHRVLEERLDYILTDPGWRVGSARVLDDGPSDHRPVIAELIHP